MSFNCSNFPSLSRHLHTQIWVLANIVACICDRVGPMASGLYQKYLRLNVRLERTCGVATYVWSTLQRTFVVNVRLERTYGSSDVCIISKRTSGNIVCVIHMRSERQNLVATRWKEPLYACAVKDRTSWLKDGNNRWAEGGSCCV